MNNVEKAGAVMKYIAEQEMVTVDRWGHVKFDRITDEGIKTYRYKRGKNVVRLEVKGSDWFRIKSYNIGKMYDGLKNRGLIK
jgi:hypothetical protein